MPKVKLEQEWKLWVGIGCVALALVAYLYFASRPPMEGSEYLWKVVKVEDRDTLLLKGSGQDIEFDLIGLEIPEKWSKTAHDLLTKTLEGKWVRIETLTKGAKGPKAGLVFLSGEDIHSRLIRQGLATVARDTKDFDGRPYIELELEAKRERKGLWATTGTGSKKK